MSYHGWFLATHIAAGSIALLAFWAAAWQRKGARGHRLAGHVFLLAMAPVLVSGIPLAHHLATRGDSVFAIFMCYLLALLMHAAWSAWRAVRDRQHPARYFGPGYWLRVVIVSAAGLAVALLGWQARSPLLMVFGGIGGFVAIDAYRGWRRSGDPGWWLREHYEAMLGCGVATHIAFIGTGLGRLITGIDPQLVQTFAWFGPLGAGLVAAGWLKRRYGRRAAPQSDAVRPPSTGRLTPLM